MIGTSWNFGYPILVYYSQALLHSSGVLLINCTKWVAVAIGGKIKFQTYSRPSVINHRSKLISGVMEACVCAVCVYAVCVTECCVMWMAKCSRGIVNYRMWIYSVCVYVKFVCGDQMFCRVLMT